MIDVSRCDLIEPSGFSSFACCESLLYLDISFTNIDDLTVIADNCMALKALNIAHCAGLTDFSHLVKLDTLELLNLRSTSFNSTSEVTNLLLLRSLDLGHTNVTEISSLRGLYRLEELLLDGCERLCIESANNVSQPGQSQEHVSGGDILRSLLELKALRLLNIGETSLGEPWQKEYLQQCNMTLCLETRSKRVQLLDAVLADDVAAARKLLLTGLDVNMVCGPWAEPTLAAAWRSKGKFGKQTAPFFVCSHEDIHLRPRLVHVAIYFNRQKCIRQLVELAVDMSSRVWLSDVKDRNDILLPNDKRIKKPEACVIKSPYLPLECCDRAVYAIVEGMLARSETKWKMMSENIEKQLTELFDGAWLRDDPLAEAKSHEHEMTQPQQQSQKQSQKQSDESLQLQEAGQEQPAVVASSSDMVPAAAEEATPREDRADVDATEDLESSLQAQVLPGLEGFTLAMPVVPKANRSRKKHLRPEMSAKPNIPDWRTHPIVSKLEGPAVSVRGSVNHKDGRLLGHRSYWLESRGWHAQAVAESQAKLEEASLKFRAEQQALLNERNKIVSNAAVSLEDSLVPQHRSTYDLPEQPNAETFGLPGHGLRQPIADRKQRMRAILNKRFHVDIDD